MDSIILLGGSGTRLNAGVNKILLPLNNLPLFLHSYNILTSISDNIILVVRKEDEEEIKKYIDKKTIIVYGGRERYLSVLNGINEVKSDYCLIHDGARPFISKDQILDLIKDYQLYDGGMLYSKEVNTVYRNNNNSLELLKREEIICAETPQLVNLSLYKEAMNYCLENNINITDDISVLLNYKKDAKIKLVDTLGSNFKVTTKKDYLAAKLVAEND